MKNSNKVKTKIETGDCVVIFGSDHYVSFKEKETMTFLRGKSLKTIAFFLTRLSDDSVQMVIEDYLEQGYSLQEILDELERTYLIVRHDTSIVDIDM